MKKLTESGRRKRFDTGIYYIPMDYVVIPKDTEERWVIDTFSKMDFEDREHLITYMKMMAKGKYCEK